MDSLWGNDGTPSGEAGHYSQFGGTRHLCFGTGRRCPRATPPDSLETSWQGGDGRQSLPLLLPFIH